jgi:hypothetical protein
MSGLGWQETFNRWEYPSVDELIDASKRVEEVANRLGRLAEAYVVGGEEIHVHIQLIVRGERHGVCVSFKGFRYRQVQRRTVEDWLPTSVYELGRGVAYGQIQAPVLVPITQDVEDPKGALPRIDFCWPSIERLQPLKRCLSSCGGALELPLEFASTAFLPPLVNVLRTYSLGNAVDGELTALVLLLAGASDQSRDEVIQGSASVMEEISKEQRPVGVDLFQRYLEDVLAGVWIELSGDRLGVHVGEPFNRSPKNVEVVHRPAPLEFVVPQEGSHGG